MVESVQLNPTGILYAKIVIDEFADKISLLEIQLGSSKAGTATSCKIEACIGPAASWEVMMRQDSFENGLKKTLDNWKSMIWFG